MKKILALSISLLIISTASAETLDVPQDTAEWFEYKGYSTSHSFSVKFPQDWQAKAYGEDAQGFAPEDTHEDSYFIIQEFEGQSYDQVLQYYVNENTELVEVYDFVFSSENDFIAKEAIYLNKTENKSYPKTLIKRGSLIIVMSGRNLEDVENFPTPDEYSSIVEEIYSSFTFTDDWHQYIDLEENYTFIFPSALEMQTLSDGVTITDPNDTEKIIFDIFIYKETELEDAPEEAEGYGEDLSGTEEILFHGIHNAISATYYDSKNKKNLNRIFVEKNETSYGISDVNIETNFPRLDYYNEYVIEMVESFEFFDIEGGYQAYKYFPDVRNDHPNKQAIDYLAEREVIAGYPDGTFKPDGEINRAELTKMIVAVKEEPDPAIYKECFPDVHEEWFAPYICYAKEQNWVEGYPDGDFKPEQNINRVEALKIILEVIFEEIPENEILGNESVADVDTEEWYGKYFIFADNRDLLDKQHIEEENNQYHYFPDKNITRKEVSETIYRSLTNLPLSFL